MTPIAFRPEMLDTNSINYSDIIGYCKPKLIKSTF